MIGVILIESGCKSSQKGNECFLSGQTGGNALVCWRGVLGSRRTHDVLHSLSVTYRLLSDEIVHAAESLSNLQTHNTSNGFQIGSATSCSPSKPAGIGPR
jgi:hypothetical protein